MESSNYPGKYIVIEGTDGTGKSTQVGRIANHLAEQGIESIEIHEPEADGVTISSEIRKVIKNAELERSPETNLLLFTASRREIWEQLALPALRQGKFVLSARNYYSTLAYQGYGEGLSLDKIRNLSQEFTDDKYMQPDLACILAMKDELERKKRINSRGVLENPDTFESRSDDFQTKVANGYLQIANDLDLLVIDASQSIDEVQSEILELLASRGLY